MNDPQVAAQSSPPMDWLIAPICEGAIILAVCVVGFFLRNPLIFSSLGATAYEQIEKSRSQSSRPYNIIVGHLSGLFAGFIAVAVFRVWHDPGVMSSHQISPGRIWSAVVAVTLTVLFNQLLKSSQPAACSTSLLVSLGSFSNMRDALLIVGGILLITVVGEPLRRIRLHTSSPNTLT